MSERTVHRIIATVAAVLTVAGITLAIVTSSWAPLWLCASLVLPMFPVRTPQTSHK